jgi:hypothetical protein
MNSTKIVLAIAVTSVMVAVALAPIMLSQALAAKSTTTTCNGAPGPCPGNSGTNGQTNKCQTSTTKAGQGGGQGEIKDITPTC